MLHDLCDQFRGRFRGLVLRLALCRLLVLSLVLAAAAIALDWWLRLAALGRWATLSALILAAGTAALLLLRPLRRRWSDVNVLTYLDALDPERGDRLISLHELAGSASADAARNPESRQLLELAVAQLTPVVQQVRLDSALRRDGLRRWRRCAAGLVVLALAVGACCHDRAAIALERVFMPWSAARWPTLTTLNIQEPNTGWRIPQGEDFQVVVQVAGVRPTELELFHWSPSTDYWTTERVPVNDSGQASYTFQSVLEPVTFYLRGGDDRTDKVKLDIIERPRLRKIVAYYTYPGYAGLANRRIESGQLRGLEGTEVQIDFETTVPVQSAVFALGGDEEQLTLTSPTTFSKKLLLRQDGQYVIKLTDPQGFRELRPERYDIQVSPDNPPEVRLLAPGRDLVATPQAQLKFAFEARDDFGLKRVEFLHAIRPKGKPQTLADTITGPIPQTGKESRAEFTWDLSKLELKHNVDLEFWVAATDCNPTGRGTAQSQRFKISLLTPTDFHNQILAEAKKVLAEARNAYLNQKKAYWLGHDWLESAATNKATGEAWSQLVDTEESAGRASEAIKRWMGELKEHLVRNRMQDALMEHRLAGIEDLRAGAAEQLALARDLLNAAHPKNSSEAQPDRLLQTRQSALKQAGEPMRLATVGFGRMLRKLYDWENLQTALVNTKLLRERQEEIQEAARQIAPLIIGREAQDLDEKTLDRILSLSQKQKTALEAETNLENQLAAIAIKADSEGRTSIKRYLLTAFGYLRDTRVNNTMKLLAARIADNQLSDTVKDQSAVSAGLKVVEGMLVAGGKNTDEDQGVSVADLLKREQADVEVARVEPGKTPSSEETVQVNEAAVKKLLGEVVPVGDDALSQALLALAEDQDAIRSRTAYLAGTLADQDMPRFKRLKLGLLRRMQQDLQARAKDQVAPLLEKSEHGTRMKPWFDRLRGQMTLVQELLDASHLDQATRALQGDIIETTRDLTQFLARVKQIRALAAEHTKSGGVDNFNRQYVLKGDDLSKALTIYEELEWTRTVQASLGRASEWLRAQKEKPQAPPPLLAKVKEDAGSWQEAVAKQLAAVKTGLTGFGEGTRESVRETGVATLPDATLAQVGQRLRRGEMDRPLRVTQDQAQEKLYDVAQRMKALVDARVAVVARPAPSEPPRVATAPRPGEPAQPAPAVPVFLSEEELAKLTTPEAIKAHLEKAKTLPPEIRARMLRELPSQFPERYRRLLGAYYQDLLDNRPAAPKGATTP